MGGTRAPIIVRSLIAAISLLLVLALVLVTAPDPANASTTTSPPEPQAEDVELAWASPARLFGAAFTVMGDAEEERPPIALRPLDSRQRVAEEHVVGLMIRGERSAQPVAAGVRARPPGPFEDGPPPPHLRMDDLVPACVEPPPFPRAFPAPAGLPTMQDDGPAPTFSVTAYISDSNESVHGADLLLFVARAAAPSILTAKVVNASASDASTNADVSTRVGGTIRRWLRRILAVIGVTKWINRENALELETRRKILQHLEVNPGSHAGQIADALALRRQSVVYQLRVLEALGFIASRSRSKIHYYKVDQVRNADPRTMMGHTARRVFDELWAGARTKRDLVRLLGLTRRGVAWHLGRLAADGFVRVEQVGRAKQYVPVEAARAGRDLLWPDVAKDPLGVA